jgi:S-adenosyl-L-methionine methyltransferase
MSRLDSVIRRLEAQRACLGHAADIIDGRAGPARVDGVVLELGLGNGRTYDHLREILPDRAIYVFDRQLAAHPDCRPDADHLFLGEMAETLPQAAAQLSARAALVHLDIGSGNVSETKRNADGVDSSLLTLLADGGVIVSDQPLSGLAQAGDIMELDLSPAVPKGRYFMYRRREI